MVFTRSQKQAEVQQVADSTPPQDMKRLRTVQEIITFVEIALLNPEIGTAVTELAIVPSVSSLNRDVLEAYLHTCLTLTPNVVILELLVFPPVPIAALGRGLLPYVEVLRTNLPHRSLLPFLSLHPTLRALELGACGRSRRCALACLDLPHITDIRAPSDCVADLAHVEMHRLRIDTVGPDTLASAAISHLPLALNALHVLSVEFVPEDASILNSIAVHLPGLRNLKLLEKSKSSVNKHAARPWSDRSRWIASLQKLIHLERLVIRTRGTLNASPGNRSIERNIFRRWVGGSHPHPMLHYIGVWQDTAGLEGGVLSEWSRENGLWQGKWTEDPNWGQLMDFV